MREAARGEKGHPLRPRVEHGAESLAPRIAARGGGLRRQIDVHVEGHDGHAPRRHGEVERHVEGVVEGEVLGVGEIESVLDALLEQGAGQRLVYVERVAVAVELPGDGGSDIDSEGGHGGEEESLDVVAADDADDVGPGRGEILLDLAVPRVDAEDQVAILGLGTDEKLGRVGQGGHGHDRHGAMLGHRRPGAQARPRKPGRPLLRP